MIRYCLRLGDTCFVLSHRLAELCSKGPYLEEDLALTNIALDLHGRAELLLEYAAELEGMGRSADDLVYKRKESDFLNHLMSERPNNDFAYVIMRQFLSDALLLPLFTGLKSSRDEKLAAIGEKGAKESAYHLRHSSTWILRLAGGTDESKNKIVEALNDLWKYTGDMFEWDQAEKEAASAGIIPSFDELRKTWNDTVKEVLGEAGLEMPKETWMASGGRKGIHSEYLGLMLCEIQYLQRAYPEDKW